MGRYTLDDRHALHLAREGEGNLNMIKRPDVSLAPPKEPLYPADEIYSVVGFNAKKYYDISAKEHSLNRRL